MNSKFLYYELIFRKEKIIAWAQGSTFAEIRIPVLSKLPVTVPESLVVQEKIACMLETIDQAIENTEALIEKYQQIKAGLMHDLFTRGIGADGKLRPPREQAPELYQQTLIGWIPWDWKVNDLGNCSEIFNGTTPSRQQALFWNGNVPWISSSKVNDYLVTTPTEYVTELALSKTPLRVIPKKSIIVGLIGDGRTRGMAARLEIDTTINQNLAAIVPNVNYSGVFIHQFLCYNYDLLRSDGRGSNQGAMNCELLRMFKIACPNYKEQEQISFALLAYENLIINEQKFLLKLQNQKSGLMHDLLTGKVQVPINNTEAAHV
jgi:type I restriction enzyme S subunit